MDNKSDDQLLIIQVKIDSNKQDIDDKQMKTNEKLTHITEDLKVLTVTFTYMMDQTKNSKLSPA